MSYDDEEDSSSVHRHEYVKPKKYLDSRSSLLVIQREVLAWLEESI